MAGELLETQMTEDETEVGEPITDRPLSTATLRAQLGVNLSDDSVNDLIEGIVNFHQSVAYMSAIIELLRRLHVNHPLIEYQIGHLDPEYDRRYRQFLGRLVNALNDLRTDFPTLITDIDRVIQEADEMVAEIEGV